MSLGKLYAYALTSATPKPFPGGKYLRVVTADAAIDIEFFDESGQPLGSFNSVLGGFAIHVDDFEEKLGKRVSTFALVKITSATNQTVEVIISRVKVEYDRITGTVTAEISVGATVDSLADDSVAAGATELVAASDANQRYAIIANLPTNVTMIRVGDSGAGAANGIPILPGESREFHTTGDLYVYNPHGAAQSVAIMRIKD